MTNQTSIPLVRLSLLLPFVRELDRSGCDTNHVLAQNGLVRETLHNDSVFVPVIVIHRFLEDAARAAKDPHFGAHVGESLDWSTWPPMIEAASNAKNLIGFLVRFIRAVRSEASSAWHELLVQPEFAVFKERRTTEQEFAPGQNDAFTAAYTLSLLSAASGPVWDPGLVRLTVCDPEALPRRYRGVHVYGGDHMGMSVRFPSAWLVQPFQRESFMLSQANGAGESDLPKPFLAALRHLIKQHLHDAELGMSSVASWVGVSPKILQRKLRDEGTTLTEVIRELRHERAIEGLVQTKRSISDISSDLGFSNPNSFTRAFRAWTGLSPREYRKIHGQQN